MPDKTGLIFPFLKLHYPSLFVSDGVECDAALLSGFRSQQNVY